MKRIPLILILCLILSATVLAESTQAPENKDSIDLHDPQYTQYFEYSEWGLIDAGVIYGYIYSPNNEYSSYGKKYRRGYRNDGPTTYGDGWFYFEKICDNWFYYEEHYG